VGKKGPHTGLTHEQKLAKYLLAPPRAVRRDELKRVKATRFFARVRCFDLACPRCGRIHSTQPHEDKDQVRGQLRVKGRAWNPLKSRLTCLGCGLTMVIGVIAWVGVAGSPPNDTQPTSGEALDLTQQWKAYGAELHGEMVRAGDNLEAPLKGGGKTFGNLVIADNPEDPSDGSSGG